MIRRPPRSTQSRSSAASDVYKQRQTRPPYNRGQPLRAAPLRGKAGGDARRTRPAPGRLPRDTLQDSLSGHQGRLDHGTFARGRETRNTEAIGRPLFQQPEPDVRGGIPRPGYLEKEPREPEGYIPLPP